MKNYLKLALVVAFVLAWYCNPVRTTLGDNSLVLQNVEALADEEALIVICVGRGSVDCTESDEKVEYVVSGYGL